MSVSIWPMYNTPESVEVNMSNSSFGMLLDLISEYGGERLTAHIDRDCLAGSWGEEEAEAVAMTLRVTLEQLDARDNVIEEQSAPGQATVIGPSLHVAPAVYFGGERRYLVEAVIEVLEAGAVYFG